MYSVSLSSSMSPLQLYVFSFTLISLCRYKLDVEVSDDTDTAKFVFWDSTLDDLTGLTSATLLEKQNRLHNLLIKAVLLIQNYHNSHFFCWIICLYRSLVSMTRRNILKFLRTWRTESLHSASSGSHGGEARHLYRIVGIATSWLAKSKNIYLPQRFHFKTNS
jgi:hypothetical protein